MIEKEWSCTPTPPICLHGIQSVNFTWDTVRVSNIFYCDYWGSVSIHYLSLFFVNISEAVYR
jgi:hypothetical protein